MLRFLSIRNLAVIDRLELEFEPGLNVLTGETGAGKSILVGAVGLLVGGRASPTSSGRARKQAAVEAIFEDRTARKLIVRREVSAQGRSRAFVNGALATTAALRELPAGLVDLHGQHEHQVLLDPARISICSTRSPSSTAERERWRAAFARLAGAARRARAARRPMRARRRARAEFLSFQLDEIERAAPRAGRRRRAVGGAAGARERRPAAAALRRRLRRRSTKATRRRSRRSRRSGRSVGELAAIDRAVRAATSTRGTPSSRSSRISRSSCARTPRDRRSPERLQEVEDRLALLERLKKKHGPTLDDVIADAARSCAASCDDSSTATSGPADIERGARARAPTTYSQARGALSTRAARPPPSSPRRSSGRWPTWRWRGRAARSASRADRGGGAVDGAGHRRRRSSSSRRTRARTCSPLARIASGGELSRIMLALKTLASTDAPGQDAHLRRSRRRHRRRGRRRRRRPAAAAGDALPGAVHHAPAADRRLRHDALPDREGASSDGRTRHRRRAARRRATGKRSSRA